MVKIYDQPIKKENHTIKILDSLIDFYEELNLINCYNWRYNIFLLIVVFGAPPTCTFSSSRELISNIIRPTQVTLVLNCNSFSTVTVSPLLPVWATLTPLPASGVITMIGVPNAYMANTTYTLQVANTLNEIGYYEFSLRVDDTIKRCTYGFDNNVIAVPMDKFVTIGAPRCSPPAFTFTTTFADQSHVKLNNDGSLTIFIESNAGFQPSSVPIKCSNSISSIDVTLQVSTTSAAIDRNGVSVIYSEDGLVASGRPADINPYILKFQKQEINDGSGLLPNFQGTRFERLPLYFNHKDNYLSYQRAWVQITTPGTYEFQINGDDSCWFFVGDWTIPTGETANWYDYQTVSKYFSQATDYPFAIMHYAGGEPNPLTITWKRPGDSDFTEISESDMKPYIDPVQFFEYETSDVRVGPTSSGMLIPSTTGIATSFQLTPATLPTGFEINTYNGIITYGSPAASPRTKYTIKACNIYSCASTTLYITVVASTDAIYRTGVLGTYYSSDYAVSIKTLPVVPGVGFNKVYERIDEDVNAFTTVGLSSTFSQNFVVIWEGYLTMPQEGTYSFSTTCLDSCRMELSLTSGATFTLNNYNTKKTVTGEVGETLSNTPTYIKIYFIKGVSQEAYRAGDFRLEYTGISPASPRRAVTSNMLQYSPSQTIYYTYSTATYLTDRAIITNNLIKTDNSVSFTSYSVDPELPTGLSIDRSTGAITGTPTTASSEYKYIVTATDLSGMEFITSVTLTVESLVVPTDFQYPTAVRGQIPQEVTPVTPTIKNAYNPRYYAGEELPYGLVVDAITGTISGIAKKSSTESYEIVCVTNSGETKTSVQIVINPCVNNQILVHGHYSVQDGTVTVNLRSTEGQTYYTRLQHNESTIYSYQVCIPSNVEYTWTFTSTCKKGGWFTMNYEGRNKIHYEEYSDIRDTVYVTFIANNNQRPVVNYPSNTIDITLGEYFFVSPTITGGASEFTIDKDLPSGLHFNVSNGAIKGILTKVPTNVDEVYSIVGISDGTSSEPVRLTLNPVACSRIPLIVEAYFSSDYDYVSWSLAAPNGNLLIDRTKEEPDEVKQYGFCTVGGMYTLKLKSVDNLNSKWLSTSYILVKVGDVTVTKVTKTLTSEMTITVSLDYIISPSGSWSYSDNAQSSSAWTNSASLPGFLTCLSSDCPTRSSVTRYYRNTITVTRSLGTVAGVELRVQYDSGIIVYVNGNKVYTKNLPENVTATTQGEKVYSADEIVTKAIVIPVRYLRTGSNYIAIELHKGAASLPEDPFVAAAIYVDDTEECSRRTTSNMNAYCTHPAVGNTEVIQNSISDAASNTGNKFGVIWDDVNTPIGAYYMWKDRSEYINSYRIRTNAYSPVRDPTQWEMYGGIGDYKTTADLTNGNIKWTLISEVSSFANIGANVLTEPFEWIEGKEGIYDGYYMKILAKRGNENIMSFNRMWFYNCRDAMCGEDGVWPVTPGNTQAEGNCNPGYSGTQYRNCSSGGIWGEADTSGCRELNVPSVFTYPSSYTFYTGITGTVTPSISGGGFAYYVSSPELPFGLEFVNATGAITGSVYRVGTTTTYTITGYTVSGATKTATISISIEAAKCQAQDGYAATVVDTTATKSCGVNYFGYATRLCSVLDGQPTWENEDLSGCRPAPPIITYTPERQVLYIDRELNPPIRPVVTYELLSWGKLASYPELPKGITYANGTFSGTPTALHEETLYVVSGSNLNGDYYANIYLSVVANTCPVDGEWPQTVYSYTAYLLCNDGLTGVRQRLCRGDSYLSPSWQAIDISDCREFVETPDAIKGLTIAKIEIVYTTGIPGQAFNPEALVVVRNLLISHLSKSVSFEVSRDNVRVDWDAQNVDKASSVYLYLYLDCINNCFLNCSNKLS